MSINKQPVAYNEKLNQNVGFQALQVFEYSLCIFTFVSRQSTI